MSGPVQLEALRQSVPRTTQRAHALEQSARGRASRLPETCGAMRAAQPARASSTLTSGTS